MFEAFNFTFQIGAGNFTTRDEVAGAVQDEDFATANPRRNGDAVKSFFAFGLS